MSDEKKRLADALEALASGQHDESDHADAVPTTSHPAPTHEADPPAESEPAEALPEPTDKARPSSPTSASPTLPREPALLTSSSATGARDPAPVAKIRAKPRQDTPTSAATRPAAPVVRPAAPTSAAIRPADPVARPAAPSRPVSPVPGVDESVERPATPVASTHAPRRRLTRKSKPLFASLAFRRTIIPVCLVLGLGMPLMAGLWLTLDEDHPARKISIVLPLVFVLVGLGVLALGVMTMLQVRNELVNSDQKRVV